MNSSYDETDSPQRSRQAHQKGLLSRIKIAYFSVPPAFQVWEFWTDYVTPLILVFLSIKWAKLHSNSAKHPSTDVHFLCLLVFQKDESISFVNFSSFKNSSLCIEIKNKTSTLSTVSRVLSLHLSAPLTSPLATLQSYHRLSALLSGYLSFPLLFPWMIPSHTSDLGFNSTKVMVPSK